MNKTVRKIHRWLALPFVAMILAAVLLRTTPAGISIQRVQQILMLTMAVTGLYLFILPWWARWRRRGRNN
ncbi:MAG: hypothetical protein Q7U34_09450 [Anaerolineales bacterium]|nr:hypothetical protein [Anaerolineales bacterium]MDP3185060.1 hypothetical protein [Anaerolineales bacterium]